jgi:hypothetical protein
LKSFGTANARLLQQSRNPPEVKKKVQPDAYPHNLNITVQSESEERQIHDLVELLLDRRRLEAMIEFGLTVAKRVDGYLVFRVHPSGSNEILVQGVNTSRDGVFITAREAIDLAVEILRDRQRQASDPANASPEAKQKT